MKTIKEILIIRLSSIGDVIHCTPVARSLKRAWPDCRISWLVGEVSAEVLLENPHIDELIVWSRERFENHLKNFELQQAFKMWRQLRRELAEKTFDAVLDIHGLFLTGVIAQQAKTNRRIGLSDARELNPLFMTETAKPLGRHITDRYLGVLGPLGITSADHRMTFIVSEDAKQFAENFMKEYHIYSKKFIILVPKTTWSSKNWPAAFFAKTASRLYPDFSIVLCGEKRDSKVGAEIRAKAAVPIINAIGKTALLQMAGLLEQAAAIVSGDTGPLYMAAALDIPTVAIFGPTDPEVFAPRGEKNAVLINRLACSFCKKTVCPEGTDRCMNSVTPEEVLQKVYTLIGRRPAPHIHRLPSKQQQTPE